MPHKFVMVLDDESDIVSVFKSALESSGFVVFGFTDPLLALQHFRTNSDNYGVIIADIRIPNMNGFEFAKDVKAIKPDIKLLLISAFDINELKSEMQVLNVDEFLQKPIAPSKLSIIVAKHLAVIE